jgi:hypothetical protein
MPNLHSARRCSPDGFFAFLPSDDAYCGATSKSEALLRHYRIIDNEKRAGATNQPVGLFSSAASSGALSHIPAATN